MTHQATHSGTANPQTSARGKNKVLVVEDDIHLLSGIRDILELENYHVITANNGVEGLRLLNEHHDNPPDIIVSDIMMPHLDGFGFLEAVRSEDRWVRIPFIFLTAKGEKQDKHRGGRLGADQYLTKPFDADDLIEAVSSSLARHIKIAEVVGKQISGIKRGILTILNHEFRTPLTLVVAYADMLKDFNPDTMSDDEVVTFLRGVNSGADRLRRLIENFIILVELESGDAAKTYEWRKKSVTQLGGFVQEALTQVASKDIHPHDFVVNIPETTPAIQADALFLTVILRELIDNAVKFSKDDTQIILEAREIDHDLVISVQDFGRGIPEAELEKIWAPFYQINREQYEDQGAGSGLAIIDGLMKIHDGTRHVSSQLGVGSLFSVRFPLQLPKE